MAKKIIFFLFALSTIKANPQGLIPNYQIGCGFDVAHQLIEGYFDIDYEPIKSLKISYTIGDNYTPGYYYDLNNDKISGLLKYSQFNTYFKFKPNINSSEKTIHPEECNGYVIGVDTFTVIQNFPVQRDLGAFQSDKKEFAEVIEEFNDLTFYKHTRVGMNNTVITYLYKYKGTTEYIGFPKGYAKYIDASIKIFGEVKSLKSSLSSQEYSEEDILGRIKLLKYKKKFDNDEKIYFNASWDEVDNVNESSYYAKIKSIESPAFHLTFFFNDNTPIYEGYFTSFFPHKKTKEFNWFYANGPIRKTIKYFDNKPQETITFYQNGKIHRVYSHKYSEFSDNKEIVFKKVLGLEGEELLDSKGNGVELFYDSISNKQITFEYEENKLTKAFYFDSNNRKIYLQCERNAKLREFSFLQSDLNDANIYPTNSIIKNNHGFALLKCVIEPNGMISKYEFIKGVDNECNLAVLNFLTVGNRLNNWKPAKEGKENVVQEIIIPIDFSIESFSRYRNNYNNYWMMHNQMMMHQMQFQPKIQAPSFR